ncbi:MAG: peptidoglycan-binding protein [Oscillatoriales cyanobacterium RU_3_3]|nr:peptidoglycan-binding protein [Oscillatoriales cyanobacterium RU_3_3]
MDGLAYLHLAETWETPADRNPMLNWKHHLNYFASAPLLFLTIALIIINSAIPAFALKRGDAGPEVAKLQKSLKEAGYFSKRVSGFYGSLTAAAVRKFQADNNLKVDGIVGPQTLSALKIGPENAKSEVDANISQKVDRAASPSTASNKPDPVKNTEPEQAKIPDLQDSNIPFPAATEKPDRIKDTDKEILEKPLFQNRTSPETAENNDRKRPRRLVNSPEINDREMKLVKTISGNISPKSIVYSGDGLFFAQNMMYSHTVTVYDRNFNLVKTIPDTVKLANYGFSKFKGNYRGAPVEAAFSTDGKYAYISNYQMYGAGFDNPGSDRCSPRGKHDESFMYRINTETLKIDKVIEVGAVPKFNAVSPDNRLVLATNWCTWDLSVIDAGENREIKRVKLGAYPRGIVVTPDSKAAYVAVMGSANIARVNLKDYSVKWLRNVGNAPRHLTIDPNGKYLYATLNGEGNVAKIDIATGKVVDKVTTGEAPRSMTISDDGKHIYVVNYFSNTVSKVRTSDMKVRDTVRVNASPIGITYDPQTDRVWVACYSGSIMVFQD